PSGPPLPPPGGGRELAPDAGRRYEAVGVPDRRRGTGCQAGGRARRHPQCRADGDGRAGRRARARLDLGNLAEDGGERPMTVTRFDVRLRRPLAGGAPFGDVGPYEELKGTLHFAIDPKHAANERIADVALAPRNDAGRLEFEADASILLPVDRARCSGRVMLDVVNRGNTVAVPNFNRATRPTFVPGSNPDPPVDAGDGFLMRRGFVVISCGWQWDLPDVPGLLGLRAPQALDAQGNRITGRVYTQLQTPQPATHLLLSDRGHQGYPAGDLGERDATLLVRDQPDGEATPIPRQRWSFALVDGGKVVPDARHIRLD